MAERIINRKWRAESGSKEGIKKGQEVDSVRKDIESKRKRVRNEVRKIPETRGMTKHE